MEDIGVFPFSFYSVLTFPILFTGLNSGIIEITCLNQFGLNRIPTA